MKRIIISCIGLIIITFVMYLMGMMMLPELIFAAVLVLPIYLYTPRGWNIITMWAGSWCVGCLIRYAFQYMLLTTGVITDYPINMSNILVRQYAGIGMIIGLFLYSTQLLLSCSITAAGYYKRCLTIEQARNNKGVKHLTNLYSITTALMMCELIIFIPVYCIESLVLNMLILIAALVILYVGFTLFCVDCCRRACARIYQEENPDEE